MSSEGQSVTAAPAPVPEVREPEAVRPASRASRAPLYVFAAISAAALALSGMLWQKLGNIQEQLARQSQDAGSNAIEARTLARQAQELARENAARQAVLDTRLGEVALQRSQVEELIQSMSRSRDENLLVDVESGLRLAQQQAQLTGSVEPLLAALRGADQRLERSGQPRLSRVRGAIARDIDRIKGSSVSDVPSLLARLDDLVRQVDELPVANAAPSSAARSAPRGAAPAESVWWRRVLGEIHEEARALVRVSRIDEPEAALVAPEQAFFLHENLKLKLLNARLALLSRQPDAARSDVTAAAASVRKYFDPSSKRTQAALAQLQQLQGQLHGAEIPRIDESLAVLATAAAGKP